MMSVVVTPEQQREAVHARQAQAQIEERHDAAGDFFYDTESSSWQSC